MPQEPALACNGSSQPEPLVSSPPPPFPDLCARIDDRLHAFLNQEASTDLVRKVQEQTRISLKVIGEALDRYDLSELSLSYNGGKDCLVLLVLYLAVLHRKNLARQFPETAYEPLQTVYIQSAHPFAEVEDFVVESKKIYGLSLSRYAKPMKAAFTDYLKDFPNVKAIFVGTRRTDPHGADLTHFDPTDHGWPSFMRIHPVIDWHYVEIWTFIRELKIPYCSLYDQGYTSLGGTSDTYPNPALRHRTVSQQGEILTSYGPAFELIEDAEERLGRDGKTDVPKLQKKAETETINSTTKAQDAS